MLLDLQDVEARVPSIESMHHAQLMRSFHAAEMVVTQDIGELENRNAKKCCVHDRQSCWWSWRTTPRVSAYFPQFSQPGARNFGLHVSGRHIHPLSPFSQGRIAADLCTQFDGTQSPKIPKFAGSRPSTFQESQFSRVWYSSRVPAGLEPTRRLTHPPTCFRSLCPRRVPLA